MMARRGVLGVLAGGATALLSGCGLFGRNSFRFKMKVELETPTGVRTGSSVYSVTGFKTNDLVTGGGSSGVDMSGEAVAVDMPSGKTLFALLRTANGTSADDNVAAMAMQTMDPEYAGNQQHKSAAKIASGKGIISPRDVSAEHYPLFASFRDLSDPTSVYRVEPNNIGKYFGDGVRLLRLSVEVTTDDVKFGLAKRLSWLGDPNRPRIPRDNMPEGIPLSNFDGLFSTEGSK